MSNLFLCACLPSICCWWEDRMVQILWKMVWQCLIKLNMQIPYDPAIIFWGTYPREMKNYVHTKICAWMFIATLLLITKKPEVIQVFVNKWMVKQTVVYTYHNLSNKKDQTIDITAWTNLQEIMPSERSQSKTVVYAWFYL